MQRNVIISIGGTGQLFLHYYAQLFLVGVVREPFDALVIDTDHMLPSLETLGALFSNVKRVSPTLAVPTLRYVPVEPPPGATVREALTGRPDTAPHPVSYLFGAADLVQSVAQGLYARPALASVIRRQDLLAGCDFGGTERVLTVGSIVGGTGGGLTAPILSEIDTLIRTQQGAADRCSLRSVFLGQWFNPNLANMPDAVDRFASNELLVSQTLAQLAPQSLQQFCFVRPNQLRTRDTDRERRGNELPWPEADHPLATALLAAEQLIAQAVRSAETNFFNKEVQAPTDTERWARWMTTARRRIDFVRAFVERSVVTRVAAEPFRLQVWGPHVADLVRSTYQFGVSRHVIGIETPGLFARRVDATVRASWARLHAVFPAWAREHVLRPRDMVHHAWAGATLRLDHDADVASDRDVYLDAVSANLLYRALRETRA